MRNRWPLCRLIELPQGGVCSKKVFDLVTDHTESELCTFYWKRDECIDKQWLQNKIMKSFLMKDVCRAL